VTGVGSTEPGQERSPRLGRRRSGKVAVVGGGLAGLTAALDLLDAGVDVTLYEARPTLGGAVQTLPERDGDPQPPPDNGQHIALGCFTEYLRFLERVGERDAYSRTRLALPVLDEHARRSDISPSLPALLRYAHVPRRDRLRIPIVTARCKFANARRGESFGGVLRRLGASAASIDRFWDVFIRPALNLPVDEVDGEAGLFTVRTALLGPRRNADLVLPLKPLGWMHGDAAGRVLGDRVVLERKIERLDELDADAVVVAAPPRESARLLGEEPPALEDSPIVSVHLWFDRTLLRTPLAALLGSDAHWVFDRGALTGHTPERGQYLTVVASGVPELLEVRGRTLVDRIAGQLTDRLGSAELLWSRVSREPYATVALRPDVVRAGVETRRPNVARAGAWTDTGWPATMESAVRSGRTAAQKILSDIRVGA
jgi:squalene-associated FAD-dependent desaturase